jgi:hypothetical protein
MLDPDEQVQTVVRLVFAKFGEFGTLHAVLLWLLDHDVKLGCGCGLGRTRASWCGGGPTG